MSIIDDEDYWNTVGKLEDARKFLHEYIRKGKTPPRDLLELISNLQHVVNERIKAWHDEKKFIKK